MLPRREGWSWTVGVPWSNGGGINSGDDGDSDDKVMMAVLVKGMLVMK